MLDRIYIYFSETDLEENTTMHKKLLLYLVVIVSFNILNYQSITACCSDGYAQEPEIEYKQALGSKGSENGQFKTPHSLAIDRFGNI